jgi:malonate transporter
VDLQRGGSLGAAAGRVVLAVLRNPLVAAPLAGALWAASGLALPGPVAGFCKLLGAAASPVALVTIGVFLAVPRAPAPVPELGLAVGLKLLVQPAITALLLLLVPLPRDWAAAALLLAALPTGTGPFMVAQLYGQEVTLAARTILLTTLLSLATVSALAWWLTV